jgi:acyl carrier protein
LQAAIIFTIGIYLFPKIGLPALNLPSDILGLVCVSLVCGWCAVSYAMCIGVFAHTQEQANGFGAISIVILAAIGGLMVPGFAMPESFRTIMKLSPLHWALQAYYGLFFRRWKTERCFGKYYTFIIYYCISAGSNNFRIKSKKTHLKKTIMEIQELKQQLKEQLIKYLNLTSLTPEQIKDDEPLFGDGLGLDSIDSLELIVLLNREYGITIKDPKEGRKAFVDINTMADYITQHRTK